MRSFLLRLAFLLIPIALLAAPPAWWTQGPTPIITPGAIQNNEGPLVLGQLKHTNNEARAYLQQALSSVGGAGVAIPVFTNSDPNSVTNIANVGQLKAVAAPFYARLREAGYNTRDILRWNGYPNTWPGMDTWSLTVTPDNAAPAQIGQLKLVFAFDISDTDTDGLPDFWEQLHGVTDAAGDADFDGLTNLEECRLWRDPWAAPTADTNGQFVALEVFTPFE